MLLSHKQDKLEWNEILLSLATQGEHNDVPTSELLIMAAGQFKQAPQQLTLNLPLWKNIKIDTLSIYATISQGARTLARDMSIMSANKRKTTFFQLTKP